MLRPSCKIQSLIFDTLSINNTCSFLSTFVRMLTKTGGSILLAHNPPKWVSFACRFTLSYKEAKDIGLQSSASRAHGILMLSESGLYKMVLRSRRRAEAIKFQDYVTREVLPSIRKTGTYTMPGAKNVPPYT